MGRGSRLQAWVKWLLLLNMQVFLASAMQTGKRGQVGASSISPAKLQQSLILILSLRVLCWQRVGIKSRQPLGQVSVFGYVIVAWELCSHKLLYRDAVPLQVKPQKPLGCKVRRPAVVVRSNPRNGVSSHRLSPAPAKLAVQKHIKMRKVETSSPGRRFELSMVDFCGKTLHGDGMVLTSHRDSRRYYFVVPGTDCQLTLQAASPKDQVQFQFRFFLVYSMLRSPSSVPPSTPQDHRVPASPQEPLGGLCSTGSYLQFYDGSDQRAEPLGAPMCGKTIPRPVLSTGPFLTLRLLTRGQQPRVDFVGHFTSLRTGLNASACRTELYFPCRNGKCIPPLLVCDGGMVDNCGDGTDQPAQPPAWCEGSPTLLPVLPSAAAPAVSVWPKQATCTGQQETPMLPPGVRTWDQTGKCKLLLASLAAVLGAVLLFWCCWSPGWFVWRVGACRHLRGCNSVCAACHLCTRSCTHRETAKVTPHGTTEPPV